MNQIASPFAIPCIRFNGLCPTFYFKRPITKKIIPNRNENPIMKDKKFIEAHENDIKNTPTQSPSQFISNSSEINLTNDKNERNDKNDLNNQNKNSANSSQNYHSEQNSFVTETPTETQIHFE